MAKKKLEGIIWPNLPNDEYYLDAEKVEYDASDTYPDGSVGKALQNKAEVDGSYESMTVGNAEQLVSNVRVNDKTPYLFRTSGGSVDIGDREYVNGIVGGTVAWNQLVQNGNFASSSNWTTSGSATLSISNGEAVLTWTGNANASIAQTISPTIVPNHKFLAVAYMKGDSARQTFIQVGNSYKTFAVTSSYALYGVICTPTSLASGSSLFAGYITGNSGDTLNIKNICVFDLTQMFGSTIADYIYSLETANAGAGVAWFKKLFNKPYYAYNAGELKSVSGLVSHDMTGFNQWDEEWEIGSINATTGQNEANGSLIRSKNYIPIAPSTTYYANIGASNVSNFVWFEYGADKSYLGQQRVVDNGHGTFTTSANAHYIRFRLISGYGTTYKNDICINLAWDNSRNGEYEPYELHSYPLDSDLTLRGIPKLDANNNLYYDGDTYEADGTVTRKYGVVDLGSLTWNYGATTFISTLSGAGSNSFDCMCAKYVAVGNQDYTTQADKTVQLRPNGSLFVKDSAYTSATAFKTAMSGVYLVYELATPTTETADPYQQTEAVNDFGTEEWVLSDSVFPCPVGSDVDYPVNLVAKLEMAPNSPDGSGDYIVRQTNGVNEYVPLVIEDALPTIPSTAGTYTLTVTVADGVDPVLSWEA